MKIENYNLRNGAIQFNIEHPDITDIRECIDNLSDAMLVALADSALANFAYRAAAKEENDGKSFSFYAACDEMTKTGTRSSGPSKADEKAAEAWFKTVASMAAKAPAEERAGYPMRILAARISANNEKWTGMNFAYKGDNAQEGYALLAQAVRLHIAKQAKNI